jgi:tetratricopeptide (TPR) repeat protein
MEPDMKNNSPKKVMLKQTRSPDKPRRFDVRVYAAAGVIILAAVLTYANSFAGVFVFDDGYGILENTSIRTLWPLSIPLHPPGQGYAVQNRPILNLTLAVNYAFGQLDPWGYHAVNLGIHIAAALTLFGLLRRILLLEDMPQDLREGATPLAFASALLWAVHPLQTEGVTFVIQRAEILAALSILLVLYGMVRGNASPRAWLWYLFATVVAALGAGCKETAAVALPLAAMMDRVFLSKSVREMLRRRWMFYLGLSASWAILAWLTFSSAGRGPAAGFGKGMSAWQYARTQFGVITHYLSLCYWPHPLVVDYGDRVANTFQEIVPYAIFIGALLAAVVTGFFYRPKVAFLGAAFFLLLAPSSSVIPLVSQTAAEKRMYLPLACVIVLTLLAARALWRRVAAAMDKPGTRAIVRIVPAAAVVLVAVSMAWASCQRNAEYRSELVLWELTAQRCPQNPRAHQNYAEQLTRANRVPQAIEEFSAAIRLKPVDPDSYESRGVLYGLLGRHDEAMADFRKTVQLAPKYAAAYYGMGNIYFLEKQYEQALDNYNKAIEYQPYSGEAHYRRGNVQRELGDYKAAMADYDKAVELRPDLADAFFARGNLEMLTDLPQRAYEDYTRAIELHPADADSYSNRAEALSAMGRFDEALADCNTAIRMAPNDPRGYAQRTVLHYRAKRYDAAWADLAVAEKLGAKMRPEFLEALKTASGRK